jgi:UDP-N-acetylmuramoylalanine--D-glutamate ligase
MIDLTPLKGKTYAVIGLGRSGLATLAAMKASAIAYKAWDDNAKAREKAEEMGFRMTAPAQGLVDGIDAFVMSPGIPHTLPAPHPEAALAKSRNIPLTTDIALFRQACPDMPLVGITGTNGKSTTTALVGHLLSKVQKTQVGGNIGTAVMSLDSHADSTVLELSSYQLEITDNLNCDIAIWLNVTPDHIDRHGDLIGYIKAKARIFEGNKMGSAAILACDDPHMRGVAKELEAQGKWNVVPVITTEKWSKGITVEDGILYEDGERVCDLQQTTALKGAHNHQNAACAYAALRYGFPKMDKDTLVSGLMDFPGLEHRQKPVRTIGHVVFINDSKATNADATSKALNSFENIYLIAGGVAKEGGLEGLQKYKDRVVKTYLIGQAKDDFAAWLDKNGMDYVISDTLDKAVTVAANDAQHRAESDKAVVLLSPACASFDQYGSYEERGAHFIKLVSEI